MVMNGTPLKCPAPARWRPVRAHRASMGLTISAMSTVRVPAAESAKATVSVSVLLRLQELSSNLLLRIEIKFLCIV